MLRKSVVTIILALGVMAARAVNYPPVDDQGARVWHWTSDYEAAHEASLWDGYPIVLATLHNCHDRQGDDGCASSLVLSNDSPGLPAYLVCVNRDDGFPGYRKDFVRFHDRICNDGNYGQCALLYGGDRAGEIARRYGRVHAAKAFAAIREQIYADYDAVVRETSGAVDPDSVGYAEIFLGTNSCAFTTSRTAPWMTSGERSDVDDVGGRNAVCSLRSGLCSAYSESWLQTTVEGPAEGSFDWACVSSETGYGGDDDLVFTIDGANWLVSDAMTSAFPLRWRKVQFSLKKGRHTLRWSFSRGSVCSSDIAGGWIANLRLVPRQGRTERRDDWLEIVSDQPQRACRIGETLVGERIFSVDSGSAIKTVSVTGLPTGLKYDPRTQTVSGQAQKRGVYYVQISATNVGKHTDSYVQVWNVGQADEGEYDGIGIDDNPVLKDLFSADWYVGESISIDEGMGLTAMTGLPPGLKFTKSPPSVCCDCSSLKGVPTKVGKYKITMTDYFGHKAVRTVIVQSHGSVNFVTHVEDPTRGQAKGDGVYAIGSNVRLTATAKKGFYFAGWYQDAEWRHPFTPEGKDHRQASLSFAMTWSQAIQTEVFARFVSQEEDARISISADDWLVQTERSSDRTEVSVDSVTAVRLTAKGLPAGVKLMSDKGFCLLASDCSKLKPGLYSVELSAKNLSGATDTKIISVRVPNLRSWVFETDPSRDTFHAMQGVSSSCNEWRVDFAAGWTVSVSGLPSGVKGAVVNGCESYVYFSGTPTKAGNFTTTLTAKQGRLAEKATITWVVEPLPNWAIGKFSGVMRDEDWNSVGVFALTASSAGKLSATLTWNDGTKRSYSAGAWSCIEDDFGVMGLSGVLQGLGVGCGGSSVEFVAWGWDDPSLFQLEGEFDVDICQVANGGLYPVCGHGTIEAQRNPFGKQGRDYECPAAHEMALLLSKKGKIGACASFNGRNYDLTDGMDLVAPGVKPPYDIYFTFSQDGTVKVSGKVAGLSISGSTTLGFGGEGYGWADFCLVARKAQIWIHVDFDVWEDADLMGTVEIK